MPRYPKLLVLDLDETLVHATEEPLPRTADLRWDAYHVYERPHVRSFLQFCLDRFSVGVWTSAGSEYAEAIVTHLFGHAHPLKFVLSAAQCSTRFNHETRERYAIKDIRKLRGYGFPKEAILFVDDSPEKFERSWGNLVRVQPWEGAPDDVELKGLARYLDVLAAPVRAAR
jgi:TFIIF-interacting CTD phosphatase-like protein